MLTDPPGAIRGTDSLSPVSPNEVGVVMTLSGARIGSAVAVLAVTDGVTRIDRLDDDVE